jgi:hypothetical protein
LERAEGREVTHENSTELKARKTVKLRALPIPRPMAWAVEAYERLDGERRVSAQPGRVSNENADQRKVVPSTAMSAHRIRPSASLQR